MSLAGLVAIVAATAMARDAEAASTDTRVRQIGYLDSAIAEGILQRVTTLPFSLEHDSPILLQGTTLARLRHSINEELRATYQAGYSIVLLDATMEDVAALHQIVGAGVTYTSTDGEGVFAYSLRQDKNVPIGTLLSKVQRSPLHKATGDPDPVGLQDEALAYSRAADLAATELRRPPVVGSGSQGNSNVDWMTSPVQTTVFQQNGATGIYNTTVNLYALHSCDKDVRTGLEYDYYMVTALADWTATNARFQSAATELGPTSMYYDSNNDVYVVANWQDDPQRTYCSSHYYLSSEADVCRYINYPLQYQVEMVPLNGGSIAQTNAKPPGSQGQAVTYTSGFSFSLGGTVNISGKGPSAGISAGMTWNNQTQTTVMPVEVDLGQTTNEGATWTFQYCTGGEEPDPDTKCTNHVQTAKDVCRAQLGDDSGTNPQQGQGPVGAFTDAVQTGLWRAGPDTRVGKTTFDIEVSITPIIGTTTANLWGASGFDQAHAGCNPANCDCVSQTTKTPVGGGSYIFKLPLPVTTCQ